MSDLRDRDMAVAERLQSTITEHGRDSMLAAYLLMYCRHLRGQDSALSAVELLSVGSFWNGRHLTRALKRAEADGYVTLLKAESPSKAKWQPTDKLIKLVQTIVDIEAPAWEDAERMRNLLAEAISGAAPRRPFSAS